MPLADVQEVINLDGVFGYLDTGASTVAVRRRTVHIVDIQRWLGIAPGRARQLVVFERNRRLHGVPVERADRAPSPIYRELNLGQAVEPARP